ncbi:MAG TPA: phosphate ABC transporter substrate-binding protein PstS [Bryobacteraceae bacterium]|nr:phosphate ABC transporter substrate-binding protein PstS [Bryobacteraceae bacterium]
MKRWIGGAGVLFLLLLGGCGQGGTSNGSEDGGRLLINGAGATFPYPIYSKWFNEYHKLHPTIAINYQSIGSGGGIRQLLSGTVDFGASDMPVTTQLLAQASTKILHFPTVLGADVPTYNLPGISQGLHFTPEALAGVFLGTIKKWNDPQLARLNPGLNLPAHEIVIVHRSDGSGTTFVWTDYLSKVSPEWKSQVGASTSVNWPTGLGAKGNEGVSGLVQQTPYSLGYVELIYALQNKLGYGIVRNAAGKFVKPDLNSVTAAAAGMVANMPADFRVSITNAPGANAYPISSFTWMLIPASISNPAKRDAIKNFLNWMLTDGQTMVQSLDYAPLPDQVKSKELAQISETR